MKNIGLKNPARRKFLRTAPVAAAAGLTIADLVVISSFAAAQATPRATPPDTEGPYKLFSAEEIAGDEKALDAKPATKILFRDKNFIVELATEKAPGQAEFEWHETRDHVVTILEGSTVYELGGKPQSPRNTAPTQWHATVSEGATKVPLKKGDVLVIRRGTPHKRTTAVSVTYTQASPTTPQAA